MKGLGCCGEPCKGPRTAGVERKVLVGGRRGQQRPDHEGLGCGLSRGASCDLSREQQGCLISLLESWSGQDMEKELEGLGNSFTVIQGQVLPFPVHWALNVQL